MNFMERTCTECFRCDDALTFLWLLYFDKKYPECEAVLCPDCLHCAKNPKEEKNHER